MIRSVPEIRKIIIEKIPYDTVVPEHTAEGHFYRVLTPDSKGAVPADAYPSVTGKLQVLKDPGIADWRMNRAIEYVFAHFSEMTLENLMEQLDRAARVSADIFEDAGDIGTRIHQYREDYFNAWIKTGVRPKSTLDFIPPEEVDVRAQSGMRALEKFVKERCYTPVWSELLVFSHELRTAGTLDDLGLMKRVIREGDAECLHNGQPLFGAENPLLVYDADKNVGHCLTCDHKYKIDFVLMDLKTSNRFKDHYFYQVALYYLMFCKLTGLKIDRCFILKVSKEDGSYQIEDLKQPKRIAMFAKAVIKTDDGLEFIKSIRRNNQKRVAPTMQL